MKKIILLFILLILSLRSVKAFEIRKNFNIDEYLNKPYIGMPFEDAMNKDIPFLLVMGNASNIILFTKLAPIGEMVYEEFKGKYNFCIINTKIESNSELVEFFAPKKQPALYIINPKENSFTFIKNRYYNKRQLRKILTKYLNGTLF